MNSLLAFDFLVNNEANTITVRREFDAERSLVWDAYTKSDILDQWWAPKPWKARTKTMDFREGGLWHYAMVSPAGEEHWSRVDFITIQPQEKIIQLNAFADANGNINSAMGQSRWELTFSDKGDMTMLEIFITYKDLAQLETMIQMGFKGGLAMGMEALDELLPTLKK